MKGILTVIILNFDFFVALYPRYVHRLDLRTNANHAPPFDAQQTTALIPKVMAAACLTTRFLKVTLAASLRLPERSLFFDM